MTPSPPPAALPPTGFPGTARAIRERCAEAALDARSFARPLAPCALATCRGTCCTHGVTLNAEETLVVTQLLARAGDALRAFVPDLPDAPLVRDADGVVRTARKPRAYHGVVPDYPAHFPDTACAFLGPTSECGLQNLADARGLHPWTYKPLACWLHPIRLSAEAIVLVDDASDAERFVSCTGCARTPRTGGQPAREVFAAELAHLGRWLDRDLLTEARGA